MVAADGRRSAGAGAAGVLAACASASSPAPAPATATAAARTTAPKPVPYNLYTHCGIDYVQVGNRYYEATPPLSDGSGNPPPGWGNPYQPGILTVISPTQAVFTERPATVWYSPWSRPAPAATTAPSAPNAG